jgi:predicted MFS family arabinose efflux permease
MKLKFIYLFRFGRRLSFFMCLAVLIIGNLLSAAAPDFWSWAVFRFIVGLTVPAIYQIPFIICK